jgi:FtsP/CotA-like multicopper oxidase with cupredoxin domain
MKSVKSTVLFLALTAAILSWGCNQGFQDPQDLTSSLQESTQSQTDSQATTSDAPAPNGKLRSMTPAQRRAAVIRAAARRAAAVVSQGKMAKAVMPAPGGTPNYFGPEPNWAWTPIIQKFMDALPGLGSANANLLGQFIPVATADTITYPGSDYYEIAAVEYTEQMHSQLPRTKLRGYVQLNNGTDTTGHNTLVPASVHYLGPIIIAQKDRPVRVKFTNMLTAGAGGDLFIPVDMTVMGAGMGPDMNMMNMYTSNRASIPHLHGGHTPWISDGTPHQWLVPANETRTTYTKGDTLRYVPDMWFDPITHAPVPAGTLGATNDPGPGSATLYWTNQQSSRLMFYHDHSYGITRLNVYAGIAAGYLIQDPVEKSLVTSKVIPADQIPLIIEDKTFVDAKTILSTDPTWNWGSTPPTPHTGDLWYPHVYMPNQNPADMAGANGVGRWDYGPWFWPPLTPAAGLVHGPVTLVDGTQAPGVPDVSMVMEGFMDTPVINGTAYPVLTVQPKAYRFRILNACNERFVNLQIYYADPMNILMTSGGSGYSATPTVTFSGGGATTQATGTATVTNAVNSITLLNPGAGYTSVPIVTIKGGGGFGATATATVAGGAITGITIENKGSGYTTVPTVTFKGGGGTVQATATATITGVITGIIVTNPGAGYTSPPTVTITDSTGSGAIALASANTEVKMVPAVPTPNWPATWPTDGRDGGVPDPAAAGPDIIQIGTEGGFLGNPAVIPSTPIGYNYNRRDITVLNVGNHGLFLGPAERADIIVDFSQVPAGSTLILYNDAPAPVPAFDPRNDYYTGDPDQSVATGDGTGGAATTLPGFGPNTRTIMQIKVAGAGGAGFDLAAMQRAWPTAYPAAQPAPIVPETTYPGTYASAVDTYARIQDTALNFVTGSPQPLGSVNVTNGGAGYATSPIVTFVGGNGSGAAATAVVANGVVTEIQVTNAGTGYTTAPAVVITGVGAGATATASLGMPMQAKAIQELFELDYGRMNATFGVELSFTNFNTQTTIPLGYRDPVTEILQDGRSQVWKITHNGVDTHAVHFHLFDVQLINRVGWDGMVKPPEPNEVGWKDTVRMNPLEDAIVAFRPTAPTLPFDVPDCIRPLDPTMPLNSMLTLTNPVDGNPISVVNAMTNFGWEYVWHCHLLAHEEMDMMRPVIFQVAPGRPTAVTAVAGNAQATVSFNLPVGTGGSSITLYTVTASTGGITATGTASPIKIIGLTNGTAYTFTVTATNAVGTGPASSPSNSVTPQGAPVAPTNLKATTIGTNYVILSWTDNANNEQGFYIERSTNGGTTWTRVGQTVANSTTYRNNGLTTKTPYLFRVQAFNANGVSAFTNTLAVTTR